MVFSAYYSFFFSLFDSMARMKLTPKKDHKERQVLWTKKVREQMAAEGRRPPSPVHHPSPAKKPSPMREEEEEAGRGREVGGGGQTAGGCGKVPIIITNLTVGPDGCRGQAICFRGGASQEEALPYCGR